MGTRRVIVRAKEIMLVQSSAHDPRSRSSQKSGHFKVYAFEIASSECRISWFQDGFSVCLFVCFSRSIPLSFMLFMHLRSLVFDSEILGPGRGRIEGTVMRGPS